MSFAGAISTSHVAPPIARTSSSRSIDTATIVLVILTAAVIGCGLWYALRDDKKKSSPQGPPPISPPVCHISSSSGKASAVPMTPHQFLTSAHAVEHGERLELTCSSQTYSGVALCDLPQAGFCRVISQNHFDVAPVQTLATFDVLAVGMPVRISASPTENLQTYFGHISYQDTLFKTLRVMPQDPSSIQIGFSGGRVDAWVNGQWHFCGLLESCGSENGQTCSSSVFVIHPESICFVDPNDNLLLKLSFNLRGVSIP